MLAGNILKILDSIQDLPTLPEVVGKINELVNNKDTTARDIAKVISYDQALSTKVLKLVNSAYYGFPRKVTSIDQVVVILGFSTIRNLVLSISVFSMFKIDKKDFDIKEFWKHSLAVASFTKAISKSIKKHDPDEMFLLGLIHDIGKLVQIKYFQEQFMKALVNSKQNKKYFFESEKEIIGFTHEEINNYLANKWNFPEHIKYPISYIHTNVKNDYLEKSLIIYLADYIARFLELGNYGEIWIPKINQELTEFINSLNIDFSSVIENGYSDFNKSLVFLDIFDEG